MTGEAKEGRNNPKSNRRTTSQFAAGYFRERSAECPAGRAVTDSNTGVKADPVKKYSLSGSPPFGRRASLIETIYELQH